MTLASRSRLCLSGLMMLAAGLYADAIPAKPGLINYRQPDGTTVEIRLIGDEHYHMYVTPEGYPLVEKEGTLMFADVTDSGLRSTGIAARPMQQLTAAEANVVNAIGLDRVKTLYNREAAKARPMKPG